MKKFVLKCLANAAGIYLASLLFPAIAAASPAAVLGAGLVLGLINLLVRPLVLLIALPVNLLTLGLFTLAINAWLLMLAARLAGGLAFPSFWLALATALIVSAANIVLDRLYR